MLSTLEMFKQTQQDKDSNARYKAQKEEIDKAFATIDEQWLSGKIVLNDLIWVIADGDSRKRKTQTNVIKDAAVSHALPLWDSPIEKRYQLNASIKHTDTLPSKALVFTKDFWVWWKQTNAVPLPQRLIDLGGCDIHVTPDIENLIAENEALKAKVAELEQRLSEYKELPTATRNKVMPIIYGLCCLYGNKGKPLTKSRASCDSIARELTDKFKVVIGDKGLEGYYKQGMDILGHDE